MKPLLCVDFDGTIWDGKLLPGCIEKLTELRQRYRIGIFSARPSDNERAQMKRLLDSLNVPYDEILERKPDAVAFIDDRGVKFTSWDMIPTTF
jgi:ribonucleotide monophosphatase NagD (HAD superfamily)